MSIAEELEMYFKTKFQEHLLGPEKFEQFQKIKPCIEFKFHYECPVCEAEFQSDECESVEQFIESIYDQGVRFKSMEMMQGVFCKECYTDPEIWSSTL